MEGLAINRAEANILQDIQQSNRDGQQEELVAQAARTLKSEHTTGVKAVHADKWSFVGGLWSNTMTPALQGTLCGRRHWIPAISAVTTCPLNPRTLSINPPNPQKTPDAPPNFRPCPAPILANSDASPANSDGPLANFGAFPTATDTYPGSPKP
ncbi:hypothetical protein E4T56_gene2805 [Termitomyces sp. T112]|nr:hypothetical protein E4T56_gene2805 [Termitomyces sp. T112]